MLLSAVSVLVVAQSSSEIPEGLMNNPVCWPIKSEADVDPMTVQVEPSAIIPLNFVAVRQMAAEGKSDKMASDMEERMKQRCVTEFLHAEKICTQ